VRVLHVIWDGGGNVGPQLGIARTLAERGHEVTVLGHRVQRERVEATGATFAPYEHAPDADASSPETDLIRDWEARTPIGAFARSRDRLMYGPAAAFARDVVETLEASPADVVAWDYILMGAGVGAEAAGVPAAALVHTVYPLPTPGLPPFGLGLAPARGAAGRARDAALRRALRLAFAPGLKALNAARAEHGLDPFDSPFEQVERADRVLVLTAPEFDFAGRVELPENVRFTGPVIDQPRAEWESPWPAEDERPLVVAGFSTTFMDQHELAARVVEALGGLPVRGLVTTGPAIDPERLPSAENVEVVRFVPHAAVLPHASLMVTHAGQGTVHVALAAGVPLVCLPGGRDQNDVAARVVFHGAGVRAGARASAEKLRELIRRALADESLRAGAARLEQACGAGDGAARAADEIERLAN
jgi:MGT family glycosyltransferase